MCPPRAYCLSPGVLHLSHPLVHCLTWQIDALTAQKMYITRLGTVFLETFCTIRTSFLFSLNGGAGGLTFKGKDYNHPNPVERTSPNRTLLLYGPLQVLEGNRLLVFMVDLQLFFDLDSAGWHYLLGIPALAQGKRAQVHSNWSLLFITEEGIFCVPGSLGDTGLFLPFKQQFLVSASLSKFTLH